MLSLNSAVTTRRLRSFAVRFSVLCGLAIILGFVGFVSLLPNEEIELDRNADGIVVLTGGTSRVTDALELLASGHGKLLLISGVNPGTTTNDIAHQVSEYGRILSCCVDQSASKRAAHRAAARIISERTVESNRPWARHVVDNSLKQQT